jgi:hypothetical protein
LWRNDTESEVIVTYTTCEGVVVSNYAVATTSSICARPLSITYISGGPLTNDGTCGESTSTTTTTTTTSCQCTQYNAIVSEVDILDATGNDDELKNNTVYFRYVNCDQVETVLAISDPGTFSNAMCVYDSLILGITYWKNNTELEAVVSDAIDTEVECCPS